VFEKLFSFKGRLGRLAFLGWTIASIGILALATVVFVVAGVVGGQTLHVRAAPQLTGLMVGLLMTIPYFWVAFALHAKRIRDIGCSPLIVIGALIAFNLIDMTLLTRFMQSVQPFVHQTMIGGLVNLAYFGALLFWPGQTRDARPPEETSLDALIAPRPSMPQSVLLRHVPQDAPRREFGLRTR
jgi:uncharacterized membrane protein YhaH (DUF805 family)